MVVGAGPAAAAFAELGDAVLTGHLDGPELARAVASADILIHPSRTEAFGNVVLEAMASGLAIVSADTDSSRQLIDHGRSGLLSTDVEDFADAVGGLAADEAGVANSAPKPAPQARVSSWDAASDSVLEAYRAVISERQGPA